MSAPRFQTGPGPFRADQLRDGDYYELSDGHPIQCAPAGGGHSRGYLRAGEVLDTDPAVEDAGIDPGYALGPRTVRAPDVAVGNVPDAPGWIAGAPPLAVEYADTGSDERDLQDRIADLLAAGTKLVWVVRLVGPRRVEEYAPGRAVRVLGPGDVATAPGLLRNPVPVEAFWDRGAAHAATLRNLLQRQGYNDLDAVRAEGMAPLLRQFERRLSRPLTEGERATLVARLSTLGADRLGDVVLDLDAATLAAWLTDPAAR